VAAQGTGTATQNRRQWRQRLNSVWPETSALGSGAGRWGWAGSAARRFWPGITPKQAKFSGVADTAPGGRGWLGRSWRRSGRPAPGLGLRPRPRQ
jgi:hypothetical protein